MLSERPWLGGCPTGENTHVSCELLDEWQDVLEPRLHQLLCGTPRRVNNTLGHTHMQYVVLPRTVAELHDCQRHSQHDLPAFRHENIPHPHHQVEGEGV